MRQWTSTGVALFRRGGEPIFFHPTNWPLRFWRCGVWGCPYLPDRCTDGSDQLRAYRQELPAVRQPDADEALLQARPQFGCSCMSGHGVLPGGADTPPGSFPTTKGRVT